VWQIYVDLVFSALDTFTGTQLHSKSNILSADTHRDPDANNLREFFWYRYMLFSTTVRQCCGSMRIRILLFTLKRMRIPIRILTFTLMRIRILPLTFPVLQNDRLRLPPFHFDEETDPAFHFDSDPDPAFHFDADPDPQQCCKVTHPL
jgi:hypothetical protein